MKLLGVKSSAILAAAGLMLLAGSAIHAQTPASSNAVFIGGTPIMRVYAAAGGYTPHQRAAAVQERLNQVLAEGPIHPTDITVSAMGNTATVRVKNHLMFTANPADASRSHLTPLLVANQLAGRMRTVLPGLTQAK